MWKLTPKWKLNYICILSHGSYVDVVRGTIQVENMSISKNIGIHATQLWVMNGLWNYSTTVVRPNTTENNVENSMYKSFRRESISDHCVICCNYRSNL